MKTIKFLALGFILTVIVSCKKDKTTTPPDPNVTFTATLSGANETPPNASTATGSATLVYNTTTKIFTITVTYSGLTGTVSGAHIHKGAIGVPGGIVFPFTNLTSPITYTSVALDASQEADLMANLYYVNVHSTPNFPGGEIRGQLIKQ